MTDWRTPEARREAFHRFYTFHLRHKAHPGAVYFLFPHLQDYYAMNTEQALWMAFINGNTQNPLTTSLLYEAAPGPEYAHDLIAYWHAHYDRLAFDTDRRYHKKDLNKAVHGYLRLLDGQPQADFWGQRTTWEATWAAATSIPTFGRLSAFSYSEYLHILGYAPDCADLLLGDSGSTSHRNGLCILTGRDLWDNHKTNPNFPGAYPKALINELTADAETLLNEARRRNQGQPWAGDVSYFTLESALCTYKSWHRPNRRYPGVYLDMLHDRIRAAEKTWPEHDWSHFWEARRKHLPTYLRLEDNPGDPGVHPLKQNHYRETGQVPVLGHEWPDMWTPLDQAIQDSTLGVFR